MAPSYGAARNCTKPDRSWHLGRAENWHRPERTERFPLPSLRLLWQETDPYRSDSAASRIMAKRSVDATKSPLRQPRRKLLQNLPRAAADIDGTSRSRPDQANRVLHERIVDFAEICFGRRGGISLRLAGIVHNFRFGNAGQMEPAHRSSAGGIIALRDTLPWASLTRNRFWQPDRQGTTSNSSRPFAGAATRFMTVIPGSSDSGVAAGASGQWRARIIAPNTSPVVPSAIRHSLP